MTPRFALKRTHQLISSTITTIAPYGDASLITLLISLTMRTGPPISLRLTLPLKICPRLFTVVTIQYFTSAALYLRTAKPLVFSAYILYEKPRLYDSLACGITSAS